MGTGLVLAVAHNVGTQVLDEVSSHDVRQHVRSMHACSSTVCSLHHAVLTAPAQLHEVIQGVLEISIMSSTGKLTDSGLKKLQDDCDEAAKQIADSMESKLAAKDPR